MFKALTEQGNIIFANNANTDQSYYCPQCRQPLKLKASSSKCVRPHFAHMPQHLLQSKRLMFLLENTSIEKRTRIIPCPFFLNNPNRRG